MSEISVTILYFAKLKESRGVAEETLQVASGTHAHALYERLKEQHGLGLSITHVQVAIDEAFASWDAVLEDGQTVAFIPPVSGG